MNKPLVWAHRGACGYAPENTLASFQKAVDMGADGLELDVQLTKDDQIVVIHDEKIDRTSNGKGWVKDYTLEELKEFDFNQQFKDQPSAQIPTMAEVFELIKPTNLTINIELKTGIIWYKDLEQKIVDLTHAYGMEDRVIYSSFNHYSIQKIGEIDSDASRGLLYADGTIDMPSYGHKLGVDALHPALYNLQFPNYLEDCRKLGLDINVWTVNWAEMVTLCCAAGVHAVIGNYPDISRKAIEAFPAEKVGAGVPGGDIAELIRQVNI